MESNNKEARKKVLRLLEIRDRSEKELRQKLAAAGFTAEEAEDAIAYAASFGYVNDLRFASSYIFARIHSKSKGRILQELSLKGIPRETALEAWEETAALEEADEHGLLLAAILKQYPEGSALEAKKMRSLQASLLRKGFSYEEIRSAVEELRLRTIYHEK